MSKYFYGCITILLLSAYSGLAQQYVRKNEVVIFSFETNEHKRCVLAKDNGDSYIVYRFGTASKIELEYPPMNHASWQKMKYFYYMRPRFDLNYLNFVRGNFRYVLYETSSDEEDDGDSGADNHFEEVGVKVLSLDGKLISRQAAKIGTQKGTLIALREDDMIGQGEEYSQE